MLNVIAILVVVGFALLLGVAYYQSRKTREELISEMKEEILSNEPAPVEPPAPVVAKVKEAAAKVKAVVAEVKEEVAEVKQEVTEVKEAVAAAVEAVKTEVKELITAQEAPAEKPKAKRRRGRPSQKKQNNSTK